MPAGTTHKELLQKWLGKLLEYPYLFKCEMYNNKVPCQLIIFAFCLRFIHINTINILERQSNAS